LKFEKKTRAGQLMILKSSKENLKKFDWLFCCFLDGK
jgi:hypothetical protein